MDTAAPHIFLQFAVFASAAFLSVPRVSRRSVRRNRIVPPLLFTVVLFSFLASDTEASLVQRSGEDPTRVRLGDSAYVKGLAAHEIRKAAMEGNLGLVASLLLTWPELVDARDGSGMTPLFIASAFGHSEVVRLLLDKGADMHATNRVGAMPFHQAAYGGHGKVVELLLERGEKVDVRDWDNRTALHLTAWKNQRDIARLLIEEGARVNAEDGTDGGATPLHYAAALGSWDVASVLLEHCADIDAKASEGATPLHLAVFRKKPELVRLLLTNDAVVTRLDESGMTALDLASLSGDKELQSLLIGTGDAAVGKMARKAGRKCPSGM
jgi:ankyrin repeat protein